MQIKYTSIPKTNKNTHQYLRIYLYHTVLYKPSLGNDILTLCTMSGSCDSHITILSLNVVLIEWCFSSWNMSKVNLKKSTDSIQLQVFSYKICERKPIIMNLARYLEIQILYKGFPGHSEGKESSCNTWDLVQIPGSGRSLREGNGYPFQ